MRWRLLFGWGIVIYAVMWFAWSALSVHGYTDGITTQIILAFSLLIVTVLAGRALRFTSPVDILPYALGWMCMAIFLDAICVLPLSGWSMYLDPGLWVGYTLILIMPLLAPYTRGSREHIVIT